MSEGISRSYLSSKKFNWNKTKHADVKIGDYIIPLIGIPRDATLDTCDICERKDIALRDMFFNVKQFLCKKCYEEK